MSAVDRTRALARWTRRSRHRISASVAFIQFKGLDELLERDGTAVAARALDEIVSAVQGACERYQVCFLNSDISGDGGKIRRARARHAWSATTKSACCSPCAESSSSIYRFRCRPASTEVLCSPVRSGLRIAAGTSSWATPSISLPASWAKRPWDMCTPPRSVVRKVEGRFHQQVLEPFSVKGKAHPVQASDIGAPVRAGSQVITRRQLPLVGRDREIELLREAIAGARGGFRGADRIGGGDRHRQVAVARRGAHARRGNGDPAHDVRGGDTRDTGLRVARPPTPGTRRGMG